MRYVMEPLFTGPSAAISVQIMLQQVRKRRHVRKVVYRDKLNTGLVLKPENIPADPSRPFIIS
jgi:hypothetical protein